MRCLIDYMADSTGLIKASIPAVLLCYFSPISMVGQWQTVIFFERQMEIKTTVELPHLRARHLTAFYDIPDLNPVRPAAGHFNVFLVVTSISEDQQMNKSHHRCHQRGHFTGK